ncbi:MAG: haloacid dehalogenase [Acidimicrobiia bacterium]|nr:MAG: haloacid dehalogenase [Acidimicrobiia bacterium]
MRPVLLDCDGVICDSEPLSASAWQSVLNRWGISFGERDHTRFVGSTDRAMADHYADLVGTDTDTILRHLREEMTRLTAAGVPTFPDALDLIGRLEGRPWAVVSNSDRWRLDLLLTGIGVTRAPVTVAGDEVERPKPHPDVYLVAAQRLRVSPGECWAVEDSPTGVAAAKAAGMRVVAVDRGMFDRELFTGADIVVPDLTRVRWLA